MSKVYKFKEIINLFSKIDFFKNIIFNKFFSYSIYKIY